MSDCTCTSSSYTALTGREGNDSLGPFLRDAWADTTALTDAPAHRASLLTLVHIYMQTADPKEELVASSQRNADWTYHATRVYQYQRDV